MGWLWIRVVRVNCTKVATIVVYRTSPCAASARPIPTKDDVDIRPGSHFTVDYGLSHYVPLTEDLLGEIGVTGYGQWQVTDDSGSDAINKDVHDRVFGIGFQVGLTYLPIRAALAFRYQHEFEAEDRFEGDLFTLTLMKSF